VKVAVDVVRWPVRMHVVTNLDVARREASFPGEGGQR
jgi:hypothetical protein